MLDDLVTWAEIDLDAIEANLRALKRHVGERVEVFAVLKANAYGHGAVEVGRAALDAGATRIAVHRAVEGIELRKAGIEAPILIMGYTPPAAAEQVARWRLTPSAITLEFAQALSGRSVASGIETPVHVKVDTGMSRYGLFPGEVLEFARAVGRMPGLRLEGLFTHFATADELDLSFTRQQLGVFQEVVAGLRQAGIQIPLVHAANSAATLRLPEAHFDAVRPGIALYGMEISNEWASPVALQPALSLKSRVSRVRELPAGAGVSYGRTFITQKPTLAALVPVGYGDGYHRVLSNRSSVLIRGRRAPVMGRVCMDQFVVDASEIPGVQQDDEVVLVGRQGEACIRAEEIASLAGTLNYEVTTSLLPRVTRVYLRGGEPVARRGLG